MPDLLLANPAQRLDAHADSTRLESQQALLVSNNPYAAAVDPITAGRRPRLDLGTLGVLGVRVDGAAQAAELALRGTQAPGMNVLTAHRVVVHSETATVPVAVDGEALRLPAPVTCSIRPGALRVRVPRGRPGTPATRPPLDWRQVIALAVHRPRPTPNIDERTAQSTEGPADA